MLDQRYDGKPFGLSLKCLVRAKLEESDQSMML